MSMLKTYFAKFASPDTVSSNLISDQEIHSESGMLFCFRLGFQKQAAVFSGTREHDFQALQRNCVVGGAMVPAGFDRTPWVYGRWVVIQPHLASIDALVAALLPGTEGQGVADVLFGDYGSTGKLPITWFKNVDQLPMNAGDPHYDPLFPFRYGLSTKPTTANYEDRKGASNFLPGAPPPRLRAAVR
ncbi:hypothetical protein Vadar_000507 [Vaccinium darrowii]|uniref:Uncharacterized protein n=1 Tax=Vaccinium darrowii TaxID=229202 RepID=A0ACB7YJC6_9ERIC|nr:hypothetical protein Vadar_000507 [Vaccinium darrowii]